MSAILWASLIHSLPIHACPQAVSERLFFNQHRTSSQGLASTSVARTQQTRPSGLPHISLPLVSTAAVKHQPRSYSRGNPPHFNNDAGIVQHAGLQPDRTHSRLAHPAAAHALSEHTFLLDKSEIHEPNTGTKRI